MAPKAATKKAAKAESQDTPTKNKEKKDFLKYNSPQWKAGVDRTLNESFAEKNAKERDRLMVNGLNLRAALSNLKMRAEMRGGRVSTLHLNNLRNDYSEGNPAAITVVTAAATALAASSSSAGPPLEKGFKDKLQLAMHSDNLKRTCLYYYFYDDYYY